MSQIIQRNLQKTRKETIAVSDDKQIRFDASVDHGSFLQVTGMRRLRLFMCWRDPRL